MKILGVLLIALGVIGIVYGGFRVAYPDEVIDAGPLQVSVTKHKDVPIPPIIGALAVAGGVVVLVVSRKRA